MFTNDRTKKGVCMYRGGIITCIMHMPCWGWGEEMNVNDFGEGVFWAEGKANSLGGFKGLLLYQAVSVKHEMPIWWKMVTLISEIFL